MREKNLLKLIFAANIIFTIASLPFLPSKVAIHFCRGGYADAWGSATTNALIFTMLDIFLFLLFIYSPKLILKSPQKLLSLPNKDFWLKPENQSELKSKMTILMSEFGITFFIFFLIIKLLTFEANRIEPVRLNERLFLTALILFIAYSIYWSIKLIRSFRIPTNNPRMK